jgi:hypothetical protein
LKNGNFIIAPAFSPDNYREGIKGGGTERALAQILFIACGASLPGAILSLSVV